MTKETKNLKEKILDEMTIEHTSILEKNFSVAKELIQITTQGKIKIRIRSGLTNREEIILYLIGKRYAHEAELAESESVGNKELSNELGMPEGSVRGTMKELRDTRVVKRIEVEKNITHSIYLHEIESALEQIKAKHNQGEENDFRRISKNTRTTS